MPETIGERFTVTETADGAGYQVMLQVDGFEAVAFCSSYHLIEDKLAQLRKAIADEAAAAYSEHPTPTTNDA